MGKERREFDRAQMQVPIQYRQAKDLASLWREGTLTDLSVGGARVMASELVEVGTYLEIRMSLPIRSAVYVLRGHVMNEKISGSAQEYGVAFQELTLEEQEEVDELVRFLVPPSAPT